MEANFKALLIPTLTTHPVVFTVRMPCLKNSFLWFLSVHFLFVRLHFFLLLCFSVCTLYINFVFPYTCHLCTPHVAIGLQPLPILISFLLGNKTALHANESNISHPSPSTFLWVTLLTRCSDRFLGSASIGLVRQLSLALFSQTLSDLSLIILTHTVSSTHAERTSRPTTCKLFDQTKSFWLFSVQDCLSAV